MRKIQIKISNKGEKKVEKRIYLIVYMFRAVVSRM
jgi:hypothetical protein